MSPIISNHSTATSTHHDNNNENQIADLLIMKSVHDFSTILIDRCNLLADLSEFSSFSQIQEIESIIDHIYHLIHASASVEPKDLVSQLDQLKQTIENLYHLPIIQLTEQTLEIKSVVSLEVFSKDKYIHFFYLFFFYICLHTHIDYSTFIHMSNVLKIIQTSSITFSLHNRYI